ncbi:hypothetical protein STK_22890 [Sulfurisphaera tokodaii str. 7]|uniref:Uncharacterized protein n=2 Tax=Sulfurisphaera tokodaii TaxID=111955 RepID=Q96Y78_SULTO|nr:hypothetical protein STK_22890 [Sulfurisphaera tokodaii str. 7]
MSEVSFHFKCNQDSILFNCNYKLYSMEYSKLNNDIIIRLNSPKFRVSFEKGKFFDMHNLLVKKGVEGEEKIKPIVREFSEIMKEGIAQFSLQNNLPLSILMKFLDEMQDIYLDPRKYLDFEVISILIDVNKEFMKDKPGFTTNRKITMELQSQKGCAKVIIPEDGNITHFYSLDCKEWIEDFSMYRNLLYSLHPTISEINEIVNFMKKVI